MPVPYAASRQDVKINLGYIASRYKSHLKSETSHISSKLLATYTQPEPTVFDAVMRTYLACWQGNFGLAGHDRKHPGRRSRNNRPVTHPQPAGRAVARPTGCGWARPAQGRFEATPFPASWHSRRA